LPGRCSPPAPLLRCAAKITEGCGEAGAVEASAVLRGQKIEQALEIIDAHLGDRLTLSYVADLLDTSPYHFARRFKRAVGMAPHQYLIRRRVERAKALLAFTDLPIADIALAVGCANQSHFSAVFHRATGATPQSYRLAGKR
jgi:AraC family transcriptional regulator